MTLDRCVQRLRRRIAEGNGEATAIDRPGTLDRTPSFYTTRSIINLSGLSVADPLPKQHSANNYLNQPNSFKRKVRSDSITSYDGAAIGFSYENDGDAVIDDMDAFDSNSATGLGKLFPMSDSSNSLGGISSAGRIKK